ncbi:hypothetical protein [Solimonas sp. SE-A11]|uniref:hypothetical protein n=1 Tax=Solimonas sp. SE-A11 TaxID=3054954 RepID=UPI00259CDECC|nr:hypothetical protein [Solimonas sp. SE-A11]MDM4772430.1 hypothetical protein [Solimonas sp. SE-A11]
MKAEIIFFRFSILAAAIGFLSFGAYGAYSSYHHREFSSALVQFEEKQSQHLSPTQAAALAEAHRRMARYSRSVVNSWIAAFVFPVLVMLLFFAVRWALTGRLRF